MKVNYAVPTLNQLEWLRDRHLPSLDFSLFSHVVLMVNEIDADKQSIVEQLRAQYPISIATADFNLGVSRSWNIFINSAMTSGAEGIVIANDDIEHKRGLSDLVASLASHEFSYLASPRENMFSCFAMRLDVARYVGLFDEEFSPAYFEDNDYHYRLKLAGIEAHAVDGEYFHKGSATLGLFDWARKQMHHHNFRKNAEYYQKKWGGMPSHERYTVPFQNGEDHDYSSY